MILTFGSYSWNRVPSTLLSIRLDSCFGLVGPLRQPIIDSNVDPARNHLYQASAPAAGIRDLNVVIPPGRPQLRKVESIKALCRQLGLDKGPRSKKHGAIYRQTVRGLLAIVGIELYTLRSCGRPVGITTFES